MIFNVGAGGATDADKIKYGDSNVGATLDDLNESVDELDKSVDELNESLGSLLLYKESAQISVGANNTNTVNVTFPSGYKVVSIFPNSTYTVAAYNTVSSTEIKITIRNYHNASLNVKALVLLAKI